MEETDRGTFIITLPKTEIPVECRLLSGREEKRLAATVEKLKKQKLPSKELTNQLKTIIVSVDDNDSREHIGSFVESMPALDSRYLRATYQKCVPNIELKDIFTCSECGVETELEVPFTTDFFWPNT